MEENIDKEMLNAILMARWESWAADAVLVLSESRRCEVCTEGERRVFEMAEKLEAQIEDFRSTVFDMMKASMMNVMSKVEE